jgi:hypothetical protein
VEILGQRAKADDALPLTVAVGEGARPLAMPEWGVIRDGIAEAR